MSKTSRFCPECGDTAGPFIGSLCRTCFLSKNKAVEFPKGLIVEVCKRCGLTLAQGRWISLQSQAFRDFIAGKAKAGKIDKAVVSVEFGEPSEQGMEASFAVKGFLESQPLFLEASVPLVFRNAMCDSCMKLSSNYHEAILQLRFSGKNEKEEQELVALVQFLVASDNSPLAGIAAIKKARGGVDFLIGSKKTAKKVAEALSRKFNSSYSHAAKLVGIDKTGKEKKRMTYCVRV